MALNLGKNSLPREAMMDGFDPNVEPEGEWATFIPRWRGAFHVHKSRQAALRSCHPRFARSGILYHKENGRWVEIERHDERYGLPSDCEMCGKRMQGVTKYTVGTFTARFSTDYLERRWVKDRTTGRVVDPPRSAWMCGECRRSR